MAGLQWTMTLNDSPFQQSLRNIEGSIKNTSRTIEQQGGNIERVFENMRSKAMALAAGFSAQQFVNQMIQVRGEFQQLEVAFKTMLGNTEKADALMEQLTKTAAITPFDLQGVANGAKQLLAYGISAEEVNDKLIHLGDIAAGLSLPLNDLVYLYGTTMTQGRMFTQDLRQFQGRGIPIAEELAKIFGVTKDKVGELVTAGKVGAKEFNQAIMAMSSEGGKFAGLMEAQSKTITGQISNIEDSIDVMFNNMGKQSEGIINGTLSVVSSLVENYEQVGKVIGGVVATYGTYKAAVMTVTALQGLQAAGVGALTTAETIHYGWLVLCEKAQKLLNATMLANPYVLAATAVAGLVSVMVTMKSEQELVNDAYDEYNRKKSDIIRQEEEHTARIEELTRVAGDESLSTDTRRLALVELEQKYPAIFAKYDTEAEKLKHIRDLKAEIAALDGKNSITRTTNELDNVEKRIKELEKKGSFSITSTNSYAGTHTSSRTRSEEAELKALQRRRSELTNQIRRDESNAYLKNLTGVSNADLKKQIDERKNLLAIMSASDKKYGKVRQGGATGVYNKDELQGQLQILESEQNRRKKVLEDSSKNFVAEADKAYKKEQEALRKLRSLTDPKKRSVSKQEIDGKKVSEMSGDEFLAAVEKQQKAVAEAKKKVDAYKIKGDNKAGTDKNNVKSEAEANARKRQQQYDVRQREEEAKAEQETATRDAVEKARIAKIENDSERERAEEDEQHRLNLQAIRKRAEEMKKARLKAVRDEWESVNTDKTKVWADTEQAKKGTSNISLSNDEQAQIDAEEAEENARWQRVLNNRRKAEADAMREYLKQYGDYQQQRQAISEEYDQKIRDARTEGDRLMLTKQKDNELGQVDERFGLSTQAMADLFADASKKSVGAIQQIINKYEALVKYMEGHKGTATRDDLLALGFTDEDIQRILRGEVSIKELTDRLKGLKEELKEKSPYQSFTANMSEAIAKIKAAKTTADKANAFGTMASSIQDFLPAVKEFGSAVANIFGKDASKFTSAIDGLDGMMTAGQGVAQMMSGDIVGGAMAAVQGVSQVVDAFDGLFGADYSSYNALVEQYDRLINVWDTLIDRKSEYIGMSYGAETLKAGQEVLDLIEKQSDAYRVLGRERLNAGASAGSHSIGRRLSENTNNEDWAGIAKSLGWSEEYAKNFIGTSRMSGLFDLTAEQIRKLQEGNQVWWAKMDEDVREYLESIIDNEEKWKAAQEQMREQITGTSFDTVFDGFMSRLYDLAEGSEDVFDEVAKNWERMMNQMVLNNLVGGKYKEKLKEWYEQWEKAYSGDQNLTSEEIASLRTDYNNLIKEAADEVDALKTNGLLSALESSTSDDKSATYRSAAQITYEQADHIEGIMTAIQIAQEHGLENEKLILGSVSVMQSLVETLTRTVSGLRAMLATNEQETGYETNKFRNALLDSLGDIAGYAKNAAEGLR